MMAGPDHPDVELDRFGNPVTWVSAAETGRNERIRRLATAPDTTRRTGTFWLVLGAVTGLGVLGMATPIGLAMLVLSLVGWFVLARRAPVGRPLGVIGLGVVPSIVLYVAAAQSAGCTRGSKVALHAGELGRHQLVPCDEVVAGYLSMALFFTMVTIGGVIWLGAMRNQRAAARRDFAEMAMGNVPA